MATLKRGIEGKQYDLQGRAIMHILLNLPTLASIKQSCDLLPVDVATK
jgi:hypothetical protein